jgi:hypothetical protein
MSFNNNDKHSSKRGAYFLLKFLFGHFHALPLTGGGVGSGNIGDDGSIYSFHDRRMTFRLLNPLKA